MWNLWIRWKKSGRLLCWGFIFLLCFSALLYCYVSLFRKPLHVRVASKPGSPALWRNLIVKDANFTTRGSYDVLLSAYMNSGSRFTGRLLGFRSDSFYFYEPLLKFSTWHYYKPPDIRCSSTNGNCRHTTTEEVNQFLPLRATESEEIIPGFPRSAQPQDLLLYVLSSIYSCRLVNIKNTVQPRVHDRTTYSGPSWDLFRQCSKSFKGKTECLRRLENVCRNKTSRVTKVIRLSVGALEPLLEMNPRIKIVHLVRDPRAIIHSRLFTRSYPVYGYRQNDSLERNLCQKMFQDLQDVERLKQKFPDRLIILYYEDLLTNLHVRLKHLYKYLNMTYKSSEVNKLVSIHVNLLPPEKLFHKYNADRETDNAFWWRRHMTWFDVEKVNDACDEVLHALGYTLLDNESLVRDTNVSSLIIPEHLRFWNTVFTNKETA